MRGRPRPKREVVVRTTIELPEALWIRAKARAGAYRTDLRALVIAALTAHLKTLRSPSRRLMIAAREAGLRGRTPARRRGRR